MKGSASFRKHLWTKKKIVVITLFLAISIVISVINGSKQNDGGDFYVFWSAGKRFLDGTPLYDVPQGTRPFVYPPFAAMLFVAFALLPLKISAGLFYFLNIVLFILSIYLTYLIFAYLYPDKPFKKLPLFFAVLFSARFFFNNMGLLQINEVVFIICLLGIYLFLRKKIMFSGALFTIAAFIKIIPVFFIGWLLIRSRRGVVLPVVMSFVICFSLPVLLRGVDNGIQDWQEYNQSFLNTFQEGRVVTSYTNQNIAAALHRMALPVENLENLDYRIVSLSEDSVKMLNRVLSIVLFVLFFGHIVILRIRKSTVTPLEISAIFLIGHLLSGITWKSHLVTFLFIFLAFLTIELKSLHYFPKILICLIILLITVIGVTGQHIVGSTIHFYMGGYNIIVWMMLIMFFYSIWFSLAPKTFNLK